MLAQLEKSQQKPDGDPLSSGGQKGSTTTQQLRILSRFVIKEKLGSGSFGHIYKALDEERNEVVAVKLESHSHSNNLTLNREARILNELKGGSGFPTIHYYSKEDNFSILAMTLLGYNLEKLFKSCDRKFSLKTVLMLADQMIQRIESIHAKGYLHRDIKPENFVMGPPKDPKTLYMIDFGLSKMYKDQNGKHNPYKEGRGLVGTARYASISTHLGIEQSRRDDLESIGYLLIYFLKGSLPWQNFKSQNKNEKYKLIADCKMNTPIEELCKGLPKEFTSYMQHVRNLAFTDQPDYKYLKKIFRQLLVESGYRFDLEYDWYRRPEKLSSIGDLGKTAEQKRKNGQNIGNGEPAENVNKKELEIYEEIKNKALEFNLEFREKTGALAFGPPQKAGIRGENNEALKQGQEASPQLNSVQPSRLHEHRSTIGKMNPKVESDTLLPQFEPKSLVLKPSMTESQINIPDPKSPYGYKYLSKHTNFGTSGRNIMPEKPDFFVLNMATAKGDSSSPELSVHDDSYNEFDEAQVNPNKLKNPFEEATNKQAKANRVEDSNAADTSKASTSKVVLGSQNSGKHFASFPSNGKF